MQISLMQYFIITDSNAAYSYPDSSNLKICLHVIHLEAYFLHIRQRYMLIVCIIFEHIYIYIRVILC